MSRITMTLSPEDVELAKQNGLARMKNAEAQGKADRRGASRKNDGVYMDYTGALGELAISRYLGEEDWKPSLTEGDGRIGDVKGVHVRATKHVKGSLLVEVWEMKVKGRGAFVLVTTGDLPNVYLCGWCFPGDIENPQQYLTNYGHKGRPLVYGIPQAVLRPMPELLTLVQEKGSLPPQ